MSSRFKPIRKLLIEKTAEMDITAINQWSEQEIIVSIKLNTPKVLQLYNRTFYFRKVSKIKAFGKLRTM